MNTYRITCHRFGLLNHVLNSTLEPIHSKDVVTLLKYHPAANLALSCLMVSLVSLPRFGEMTLNASTLKEMKDRIHTSSANFRL